MARKVIIDCDPGIDDAVALCLALFDPRLEVLAVTATEGNASADQTTRNVQAVIEQLDPPRYPRLGVASPIEIPPPTFAWKLHGNDGLADIGYRVSELHHQHLSEKVICDVVRSSPDQVTIIALGPLTNLARALRRDPELATMIGQIIMMGGTVDGIGNVTPTAEFNIYYDPESARTVFQSATTKTLVPLDVTRKVTLFLDFVDQLPEETSRAGKFLRDILTYSFRVHRQNFGMEGIQLHDVVAIMLALHPELFETEPMAGDVETQGELTKGATVFDRRPRPEWQQNMEVATLVDVPAVIDGMIRGLRLAGT
ncbi:MAG: nucleoside hydrolase [Pirellulaceae bacterium]|nr:nucleoside hydrolase [Planctomycetales bacterium]